MVKSKGWKSNGESSSKTVSVQQKLKIIIKKDRIQYKACWHYMKHERILSLTDLGSLHHTRTMI